MYGFFLVFRIHTTLFLVVSVFTGLCSSCAEPWILINFTIKNKIGQKIVRYAQMQLKSTILFFPLFSVCVCWYVLSNQKQKSIFYLKSLYLKDMLNHRVLHTFKWLKFEMWSRRPLEFYMITYWLKSINFVFKL